jgi:uncharacterized membrane protein
VNNGLGSSQALEGVDRAALVLAVLAGAITIAGTDGDWVAFNSFIGVLLFAMVAGFHRPVPVITTARTVLMRIAFLGWLSACQFW